MIGEQREQCPFKKKHVCVYVAVIIWQALEEDVSVKFEYNFKFVHDCMTCKKNIASWSFRNITVHLVLTNYYLIYIFRKNRIHVFLFAGNS